MARQSVGRRTLKQAEPSDQTPATPSRSRDKPRLAGSGEVGHRVPAARTRRAALNDAAAPGDAAALDSAVPLGERLAAGFANAVRHAVAAAHAAGLAVPGRDAGAPVEHRPDGKRQSIRSGTDWSPAAWKTRD